MARPKRSDPRIPVETLCSEVVDDREHFSVLRDLSPQGVRLERPFLGRRGGSVVQLEFELPDADEIIWARGEVCFDHYQRAGLHAPPVRTTGVRLVAAASRHLRMIRDWVAATVEARRRADEDDLLGHLGLATRWNS